MSDPLMPTSRAVSGAADCSETFDWIRAAMCAGGELTMRCPFPGKAIFNACMSWPDEDDMKGNISMSVFDALRNLEGVLKQDGESQNDESIHPESKP